MTTRNEAMPSRLRVGKSGVTPCKHDLLNKLLGREAGTLLKNPLHINTYAIVDLTAGDGVPYGQHFVKGCSPGIILNHAKYIATKTTARAAVVYIEKQPETYGKLVSNLQLAWDSTLDDQSPYQDIDIETACMDAKSYRFPAGMADAAFLYNDPNHIEDWCLEPETLATAPRFTTSLSTLGCNVGGMKRLDLDKRELWFDRINMVTNSIVQPWHDACLFSVGGADQWAYLITAPKAWSDRITQDCLAAASKIQGREADARVAWFKQDPTEFLSLQKFLFLTKAENAQS